MRIDPTKSIDECVKTISFLLEDTHKSIVEVLGCVDRVDLLDNDEFCSELNSKLFQCYECGYWKEKSYMSEHYDVCLGCYYD